MKYRNSLLMAAVSCAALTASGVCAITIDETKLTPDDGVANDYFGRAVAISGTTALIGAYGDDDNGVSSGSAYLFDQATGTQIAKLTASDGSQYAYFGVSVALTETKAIIGAFGDDENGVGAGAAYLFDTVTGAQIAKLMSSDLAADDNFGISVAISGSTAIVGARLDDDNGTNSGSAYLFDVTTGTQIAKLTASDGAAGDSFGVSVAISGSTAIVGAFLDDDDGSFSGSAYLFDVTTGTQIAKLTASDGAAGDNFGVSVAISGTTAIVGAQGKNAAYMFDTVTGTQIAKLTASDGASGDNFGRSVAITGTTALVGAMSDDDQGSDSGSAYLFDLATGAQIAKLTASDGAGSDYFGNSVALFGSTALVGAYLDDDNGSSSGAAYLYNFAEPLPAVPLPAGVWLLSAALGGLSVLRRGRRA